MNKVGLDCKVSNFFKDYLVGRKTRYLWNNFLSPFCSINFGVRQGSALSLILSALYLSPILHIFEKHLKTLKIPISIILFIDDGLFISQNKSISHSNANLFCSYNVISFLLSKFGLIMEHGKMEVFHFSRSQEAFNPPPLNLSALGGPILLPKNSWQYLGFIFDRKLTFQHYIEFYTNKAISTVKWMKILGNSSRGINPIQKRRLYKCCALSITLYGLPLWYYNKALTHYHLNVLWKIQQRAALWISGVFHTSPTAGVEVILGLVPIHIFLKKLYGRFLLRELTLPSNHIISNILSSNSLNMPNCHNLSINLLTPKQRLHMKSALIDMDNKCNELIPFFSFFNEEFRPGNCLIDSFSDRLSFYPCSSNIKKHMEELDNTTLRALSNTFFTIVVSDASIKNHVTTSISHIHSHNRLITKTIHRAANVSTTEAELFAIWCGIN